MPSNHWVSTPFDIFDFDIFRWTSSFDSLQDKSTTYGSGWFGTGVALIKYKRATVVLKISILATWRADLGSVPNGSSEHLDANA